jgi:hypothetical protein
MTIKIDLGNQVRQTVLPQWKPLLPLFEAVMNSFQALRDAKLPKGTPAHVTVSVIRENDLFKDDEPAISGFEITDNGIGLDDSNFDSFNTAFSRRKALIGGKGLGRFTWLKAFEGAQIESVFSDGDGALLSRSYIFDEGYTLDTAGLPKPVTRGTPGTTITLNNLRASYKAKLPRSTDVIIQKMIEHFILVFLEPDCPMVTLTDQGLRYDLNEIFEKDYRQAASKHIFKIEDAEFVLHGFRLPTTRTTKHKLVYAADQRGVVSDKLEDFVPNLSSRLEDQDGNAFFYLAIIQSPYLSEHVNIGRTDFDFASADDADLEAPLLETGLIPRAAIRERAIEYIESDLETIIETINASKIEKIRRYIQSDAPQYRILLRNADRFINKLSPSPSRAEIETALHRELHQRETELKRQGSRIIKEADKIDNYEDYHARFSQFLDDYNELGLSALAQYVGHRKIIIEFLERAISLPPDDAARYPLEEVVHRLVFPMQATNGDTPYNEQNLWMIDERLTYHSFIASDKQLRSLETLKTKSAQRGDIVVFDEKIVFSDVNPAEHPINSITTIEFKRPGRDNYTDADNPLAQAFKLVEEIRNSEFQIKGRPVPVSNKDIPASLYCICDLTPSFRRVLKMLDAFVTPDNQGYYGFHRGFNAYYEVIDYTKMLRDAKNRNRVFFEKLNLVNNH